jgi:pyruvate/2-oxoglutarate dehydrogenase complex dihydrolipoamide acyltransferase (E2) component
VLRFVAGETAPLTAAPAAAKAETAGKAQPTAAAAAVAGPASQRKPRRGDPYQDKPATSMRKVIASRLTTSKVSQSGLVCSLRDSPSPYQMTVPHAYTRASADVTTLIELRKKLIGALAAAATGYALASTSPFSAAASTNQKFSINDVVVKAAALALRSVPGINVVNDKGQAKPQASVDISIAVATPGGLITPIIFNADQRSVLQISQQIAVSVWKLGVR